MYRFLPHILCLLIGVAGWFYAFYSRAASNLRGIEADLINRQRIRLRRAGGLAMLLLAASLYVGFTAVDATQAPQTFVLTWLGVMLLMAVIVVLGLFDLRLTARLRARLRNGNRS